MVMSYFKKYYWLLIVVIVAFSFYKCGRNDVKEMIVYKDKVKIEKDIKVVEKLIKGQEKEVIKYVDRVKYLKDNTPTYPKECDTIVMYKDSIINYQDTIIQYKDSVIIKKDTIIQFKDRLLELPKTRKRFGLGINSGYGIDNRPYVGFGVSYNLFVF